MFKNMLALRSKLAQTSTQSVFMKATPKRLFSYKQMQPNSGPGLGTMLGVGLGTAGLMYLMYHSRNM